MMTAVARVAAPTQQGKTIDVTSTMEVGYIWHRPDARRRVLTVEAMVVRVAGEGKTVLETVMSRQRFVRYQVGKNKIDLTYENAPEEVKAMLREMFGGPLCELEVDEAGREVKRTMVAGAAARRVMSGDGLIVNTLFLHPQPPGGREAWEADAELSGEGVGFKGRLSYKKAPGGKGGQAYAVSGTLTQPAPQPRGAGAGAGGAAKVSTCVVTGEQTFDPARRQWVAAKLNVDMSLENKPGGAITGTTKGTMVLTLEAAPETK